MNAARWYGPGDIRVEEMDTPRPAPGQTLIRVDSTGICGTDLEEFAIGPVSIAAPGGGSPSGLVLGHEVIGTVVECPGGEWTDGTRVVPDVVVGCGGCWWCKRHQEGLCPDMTVRGMHLHGGLAQYMLADAGTCVPLPDSVPDAAAVFAEPLAVATRALDKAGALAGAHVCVTGAGSIGLLVTQVALLRGAVDVIASDVVDRKVALARRCGATAVGPVDLHDAVYAATGGRGADVVVECSGRPDVAAQSINLVRRGGTVVLVGFQPGHVGFPLLDLVLKELRILGSAAHLWDVDVAAAVALLRSGAIQTAPLLTDVVALGDAVERGFRRALADPECIKIVIHPNGAS
jgi:2-desacetyl-2-hydroxyethyl bacteriochlorophyllide A dehydrogenase